MSVRKSAEIRHAQSTIEGLGYIYISPSDSEKTKKEKIKKAIEEYDAEIDRIKSKKCMLSAPEKAAAVERLKQGIKVAKAINLNREGAVVLAPAFYYAETEEAVMESLTALTPSYVSYNTERFIGVLLDAFKNQQLSATLEEKLVSSINSNSKILDGLSSNVGDRRTKFNETNPISDNIFGRDGRIGRIDERFVAKVSLDLMARLSEDYSKMLNSSLNSVDVFWLNALNDNMPKLMPESLCSSIGFPDYLPKGSVLKDDVLSMNYYLIPHKLIAERMDVLRQNVKETVRSKLIETIGQKNLTPEISEALDAAVETFLAGDENAPQAIKKPATAEEIINNALAKMWKDKEIMAVRAGYVHSVGLFEGSYKNYIEEYDKKKIYGEAALAEVETKNLGREIDKLFSEIETMSSSMLSGYGSSRKEEFRRLLQQYRESGFDRSVFSSSYGFEEIFEALESNLSDAEKANRELQRKLAERDEKCALLYASQKGVENRTEKESAAYNAAIRYLIDRGLIETDESNYKIIDDSRVLELAGPRYAKHQEVQAQQTSEQLPEETADSQFMPDSVVLVNGNEVPVQTIQDGVYVAPDGFIINEFGEILRVGEDGVVLSPEGQPLVKLGVNQEEVEDAKKTVEEEEDKKSEVNGNGEEDNSNGEDNGEEAIG